MEFDEKVLIVEDDIKISRFISYALDSEKIQNIQVTKGQDAVSEVMGGEVDIMLLDLGLPDIDGMDVIKRIREWSEIPIIVVSARDQDKEKADALNAGADDYLTKPFSATELMARVRVAIRHLRQMNKTTTESFFSVGDLSLDIEKRIVTLKDEKIHLTPMEYSLMCLLFKNMGKVLTTDYILESIWGKGYGSDTQALRTLMAGLRRKVEENPAKPRYIITEVGVGYRLLDE